MTSKGSPYSRFQRAINAGNLAIVEGALRELPSIGLEQTLEVVALMARTGDPRYQRAAARWCSQITDQQGLSVDESRQILALLELLPEVPAVLDTLRTKARR